MKVFLAILLGYCWLAMIVISGIMLFSEDKERHFDGVFFFGVSAILAFLVLWMCVKLVGG